MPRRVSIGFAVTAVLALVAIAIGLVALHRDSQNLTRIHHLEAQVRVLRRSIGGATASVGMRVGALERRLTALQATTTGRVTKQANAEAKLARVISCVPELQTEIKDLETKAAGKRPAVHLSKKCSQVLIASS